MSGTDYTQTTNYGLYKPIGNADNNAWGSHWNLNADTLDGLLYTVTGGASGPFLPMAGGSLAGPLLLQADPTGALGAATRQYVDGAITRAGGPFLALSGGTVTGPTTHSAALTASAAGTGLAVTNNATVGGTLGVTGAATLGTLTTTGGAGFGGASSTTGTNTFSVGTGVAANNVIRFTPATAGNRPSIAVLGPDTNEYLNIVLAGGGYVQMPRLYVAPGITTLSGGATLEQTPINFSGAFAGSFTDNRNLNLWNINGDTAAKAGSGTAAYGYSFFHSFGGGSMSGGRTALNVLLSQTAATQNTGVFYQATNIVCTATQPEQNGNTPSLHSGSIVFSLGAYSTLAPTALGYNGLAGYEQDIIAGAQPFSILGMSVVRLTGGYGTLYQAAEPSLDTGFRVASGVANTAAWIQGYTITSPTANFALDTAKGTAFKIFPGADYQSVKPAAAVGIDLSYVSFSTAAWHSQGAIIDGGGHAFLNALSVGNWDATVTAAGLSLATTKQIALSATVASGGSLYGLNGLFSFAGNGLGIITSVSGNVVTGVAILEYPTTASPPTNPVATTSLMFAGAGQVSGTGLTLNLTWSAANGLGFNGATPVVKPTVTGAKGSNAALASLMTALAAYGLVTDSTSA